MSEHHGDAELADGLIDLAVNVGPTPPWLRLDGLELAAYPRQDAALAAVARHHRVDPGRVLLTAGAAEAFVVLARAVSPRRAVVVHPQFSEPEAALRAAGHAVERVVLGGDFTLDPAVVPADADLVVVGNPTNPTGVLHDAATLGALRRPGRLLVVDEAFLPDVAGDPRSLAGEDGVLVVRSLTKAFGLAGLRAGYAVGDVGRLRSQQPAWPVSTPALSAIVQCLSEVGRAWTRSRAEQLVRDRIFLEDGLRAAGFELPARSAASFVLARRPDADAVRLRLRQLGFAVRRGDTFPGLGPDWIRVAVRPRPVSAAFLAALAGGAAATGTVVPRGSRVLVLGGSGSGKSEYAERRLIDSPTTYLAPGQPTGTDPEWDARVQRHRERRPAHWTTEETLDVTGALGSGGGALLVDCLSTWLARLMDERGAWDGGPITDDVDQLVAAWRNTTRDVVLVSSEVGSGVVPATESGRRYRDELGRLNQRVAATADEVWLVTAGIPTRLR